MSIEELIHACYKMHILEEHKLKVSEIVIFCPISSRHPPIHPNNTSLIALEQKLGQITHQNEISKPPIA